MEKAVTELKPPLEVQIRELRVKLEGREILKGVSLSAKPGAVTAVMGPSGSGKSTLLKTINRLIEYYPGVEVEGDVVVGGVSAFEMDPYLLRRYVAMVFQTPNPFPHLTIYDNVALGPRIHGLAKSKKELDEIVRWALEKAMLWDEVKDRLNDYPSKLSGGQQQRLSLARALALRPPVLLLDEPTANIDPVNTKKIEEAIIGLAREEGTTVLIVTHTPQQAARISDYIAVLYEGRLVEWGPTKEVVLRPRHEITRAYLKGEI